MASLDALLKDLPEKLSEQDARKLLQEVGPIAKNLETQHIQSKTKSDQGQAAEADLLEKAKSKLGVTSEADIVAERDRRYTANAQMVREYLTGLRTADARLTELKAAAPKA